MSNINSSFLGILSSSIPNNNLSSLEQLKIDIKKKLKVFSYNIKALKKQMSPLQNAFYNLEDQEHGKAIEKLFKNTIGISIDELVNYIQEQEKAQEEFYLFEARFIEYIINIISAIIEFQKRLDSLYPNLSKKIVDYLSDFLVALLATQMPIVAIAIKSSGILDTLKSYISTENLTNTLNNWKDKLTKAQIRLTEVKEHKTLKEQFVLAQQVEKLSEITGVSVVEISELRLESKSIKQIISAVLQNPKTIESLKKIIELSKAVPHDKSNITKTVSKLTNEITKILGDISGIDKNLIKTIKEELSHAKENLIQASIPNKNIMEKLDYCHKAAKNIFCIYNKITEATKSLPNKNNIVENIANLIKEQTKSIIPSIFLKNLISLMPKLESLSQIIKIENVLKIAFESNNAKTFRHK